jgi:hypothetical protein
MNNEFVARKGTHRETAGPRRHVDMRASRSGSGIHNVKEPRAEHHVGRTISALTAWRIISHTPAKVDSRRVPFAFSAFEEQGIFPCSPQCVRDPPATPSENRGSASAPRGDHSAATTRGH